MPKRNRMCMNGTTANKICCCCLNSGCHIECPDCGHREFIECHSASGCKQQKVPKNALKKEVKRSVLGEKNKLLQKSPKPGWSTNLSVIDPQLELSDPNPDIEQLFREFDKKFFKGMLSKNSVTVIWSRRLKASVGNCRDEYPPIIHLSEPLLKLRPRKDTVETLLHEMIHAYLAVAPGQFEEEAHGPKFHREMKRIDRLAGTNLQVEHDFFDEMDHYAYIWECDGKCKKRIINAYNKPPSNANVWWDDHLNKCGGKFKLVHDPKNNKNCSNNKKQREKAKQKTDQFNKNSACTTK